MKGLIILSFISFAHFINIEGHINPNIEVYEIREDNNDDHNLHVKYVYPKENNYYPRKDTKLSKLLKRYNINRNNDKGTNIPEYDKVMSLTNTLIEKLKLINNEGILKAINNNDDDVYFINGDETFSNDEETNENIFSDKAKSYSELARPESNVIVHLLKPENNKKIYHQKYPSNLRSLLQDRRTSAPIHRYIYDSDSSS